MHGDGVPLELVDACVAVVRQLLVEADVRRVPLNDHGQECTDRHLRVGCICGLAHAHLWLRRLRHGL